MTSFSLERANGGINSPTAAIFSAVRADLVGLPLPARRVTADPVSSTRRQIVFNVLKLQFCQDNLLLSL